MKRLKILSILFIILYISVHLIWPYSTSASNISATNKWAWNDVVGWIDFYVGGNGMDVNSDELKRWGVVNNSSSSSYIAVNCDSVPPGGTYDCSPSFSVTNSSSTGDLAGYAWSDEFGWIKFADSTASSTYGVDIGANGDFTGWAWNDIIGWISFNCSNHSGCGTSNYYVNTTWRYGDPNTVPGNYLESATFDTGSNNGFAINSIYWEGSKPSNTTVGFQIAASTSTTAFSSNDFVGRDGSIATMYEPEAGDTGTGKAIIVNGANHHPFESGYRYFRYRVYLDKASTSSPVVSEVNINWTK